MPKLQRRGTTYAYQAVLGPPRSGRMCHNRSLKGRECGTAGQAGEQRTVQFDSIATSANVTGSWQGAVINSPQYNGVTPMYVTVEDKAGKKKTIVNPDASAVAATAWTAWKIKLSDLTGVNLAAVQKTVIGVGDRQIPKPGDTGRIYIDDIRLTKRMP
jgi:hypothetical protein